MSIANDTLIAPGVAGRSGADSQIRGRRPTEVTDVTEIRAALLPLVRQRWRARRAHREVHRATGAQIRARRLLRDGRWEHRVHHNPIQLRTHTRTERPAHRQDYRVRARRCVLINHIRGNRIRRAAVAKTPKPIRNRPGASVGEGHCQRRQSVSRSRSETG